MDNRKIFLYDTTLRDGTQSEDVNFTVIDKLRITERLIDFGIDCIEVAGQALTLEIWNFLPNLKVQI